MFARDSFDVYTVYIQGAENGQKNESLSKNKSCFFDEDLLVNRNISYKLSYVSKTD